MKLLLVNLDIGQGDAQAADFRDFGHAPTLLSREDDAAVEAAARSAPDVVIACLEAHPRRALDLLDRLLAGGGLSAAQLLFAGGTEAALAEAQRRHPRASFTRLDALHTALASLDG